MAERPIKKADRQNPPVDGDNTPKSSETSSKKSSSSRGGEKGKRDSKRDEPRAPENLALMRGPKPSKTPPPIVKEADTEVVDEETSTEEATPTEES
jgi:hypothetical protein